MSPTPRVGATHTNDPAVASFGTLIQVLSSAPGAAEETFETVAGVHDIDGPSRSTAEQETTSHSTGIPVRTFIASLRDPGELSFPVYFNPAFPTHSPNSPYGLERLWMDRTMTKWRLVNTDAARRTREFFGFVRDLGESYAVEGINTVDATVRISGDMVDIPTEVTLAPTSAAPTAAGGPATFDVTVAASGGGGWFPISDSPWITIVSPVTGQTGDGTVSYTVAAQTAAAPARSGKITVGDQTFDVDQAAGA